MTQLDHFDAILDANPADWDARLALADCLAEQAGGECPASRCQRWMARHRAWPNSATFLRLNEIGDREWVKTWRWFWTRAGDEGLSGQLPPAVFLVLASERYRVSPVDEAGVVNPQVVENHSRTEAEADLAAALDYLRREYGGD